MHAESHHLFTWWIIKYISHVGYVGLYAGMLGQAVGMPLPSEAMLSFSGYLASSHVLSLALVFAAGTLGDVSGAVIAYLIGYYGGRPLLVRFGRSIFIRERELERADAWFARYGSRAVLFTKLLPGIRALASYPAGVTRMPLTVFVPYTLLGSAIWCAAFSEVGYALGRNWARLGAYARPAGLALLGLLAIAIVAWVWMHLRAERRAAQP
jgi:membrane protein DedA with SNARE-associated domain